MRKSGSGLAGRRLQRLGGNQPRQVFAGSLPRVHDGTLQFEYTWLFARSSSNLYNPISLHEAVVAQLVEQLIRNQWVGGSTPLNSTN